MRISECVACGKSFATEIILGKKISTIKMHGINATLPVHDKCCDDLIAIAHAHEDEPDSWKYLPEGPLRREFARVAAQLQP